MVAGAVAGVGFPAFSVLSTPGLPGAAVALDAASQVVVPFHAQPLSVVRGESVAAAPPQRVSSGTSSSASVMAAGAPLPPSSVVSIIPPARSLAESLPSPCVVVPANVVETAPPPAVEISSGVPHPSAIGAATVGALSISGAVARVPASAQVTSSGAAIAGAPPPLPSTTGSTPPTLAPAAASTPLLEPEALVPASVATSSIEDAAMAAAALVLKSQTVAIAPSTGNADNAAALVSGVPAVPAPAAGASVARLTTGERVVSFLVRAIFHLSPPDIGASKVATPALLVAYFACRMAFLAGTAEGDDVVYNTMTAMFKSPIDGWKCLCGMFGVSDRGLFLSGRLKRHAQFVGQPPSVQVALNNVVNPEGKPQWLSRRISLRKSLYLYPAAGADTPGSLTADELFDLRKHLDSPQCRSICAFMGCKIMPGTDPDGNITRIASVEFDWAHTWVPSSTPARLVDSLKGCLLKPPNADLSRVTAYPRGQAATAPPRVSPRPPTAASPVEAGSSAGGPSALLAAPSASAAAPSVRRASPAVITRRSAADLVDAELDAGDQVGVGADVCSPRIPERTAGSVRTTGKRGRARSPKPPRLKRGASRFKVAEPKQPVDATPPPLMTGDEVVGCVGPSAIWPDGAWAIQVPLPPRLDALAVGRPQLDVALECNSLCPDANGEYDYVLVVTQEGDIVTDLSKELGAFVTAAPGLDDTCRSLDFLRGIRRIAEIRRWESPSVLPSSGDARLGVVAGRQRTTSAARMSVERDALSQDRGPRGQGLSDPTADDEADGGSDAIDYDKDVALAGDRGADAVPAAFNDVHLTVTQASRVRDVPFAYRFSFATPLRLNSATTICLRDAGRLVIVIGAERERRHFRIKA